MTSVTKKASLRKIQKKFPEPFVRRESRPSRNASINALDSQKPSSSSGGGKGRRVMIKERKKPQRLICGINEVTRALEKKTVELVVVSRDITPAFLITHIPVLCYLNSASLVVLSGDGTELGHILGTRRLLALGILKKTSTEPESAHSGDVLVKKLQSYRSTLEYPWLAALRGEKIPNLPDPVMVPHKSKNEILAPLQK